jgi:integrase
VAAELSARGLAPATVQKSYQLLGKVMGAAVDAGMLAQSPCRRVPLPKVEREEMRFLTPAEVATLADAIAPRCRALVLVGAYGGLRIGELAGLRRSRVDLLRGTVTVAEIVVEVRGVLHIGGSPKTRASRRTVGLPRFVVEELAAHIAVLATRRRLCSPRRRVARCASTGSGLGCGGRRPGRPAWTGCASTTCATPPSPCGSQPGPTPRRSRLAPDTPR